METIKKYYRIDRTRIAYVRFILEAYDGVANMTTIDPHRGVIRMNIAPGCRAEMNSIISDLKRDMLIEPVEFEPESFMPDSFKPENLKLGHLRSGTDK